MIIFDKIETAFIKENGIEVLKRDSGEKTIERAQKLNNGSKFYPVYYSKSATFGEKNI